MPVTIHPHLDFERLLQGFLASAAENSDERTGASPSLSPRPLVIPSRPFADLLQKGIADHLGICMGWEFFTPQEFVHRAVGPGADSPWQKSRLLWHLLPLLQTASGISSSGLMGSAASPRDRFALAGVLADRLDQYGHFRPEWIRAWAEDATPADFAPMHPARRSDRAGPAELWQRELWQNLAKTIREKHPALSLAELQNPAASGARQALRRRFPELIVLCSGSIDPLLVEVLQVMDQAGCALAIHALLPTLAYLGELRAGDQLPDENTDPEEMAEYPGHPLVVSMARHSIGAFLQLGKLDEQYTAWPERADATLPAAATILGRLQEDIRSLRMPAKRPSEPSASGFDSSLTLHECFGPRREVEVLRDEILRALRDFPDLRLEDIHVVTGDPETYAPLIPALFEKMEPSLPVRLVEVPSLEEKAALAGLLALLEIARRARFECSEVLELYRSPTLLKALETEEADTLGRWITESGLVRGLANGVVGSLPWACERLLAGMWLPADSTIRYPSPEDSDPANPAKSSESAAPRDFVLPVADSLRGDSPLRMRFLESLSALTEMLALWENAPVVSATEWAERLQAAVRDFLRLPDEEAVTLTEPLAFLAGQGEHILLDAGAVGDWLAGESAAQARRTRHAGKIAFGSFRNLQNLPCRILAMVGMGQDFPARNQAPSWDLLRVAPKIWDRNPRTDDRQLFLDALLTPTERLILTATTRNVRSGKSMPCSACVEELRRVVEMMGEKLPAVVHALHPFSSKYFAPGDGLPRSFSLSDLSIAREIQRSRAEGDHPARWVVAPPSADDLPPGSVLAESAEISVGQLVRFWKDPARAFLQARNFWIPRDQESEEALDRLPIELDNLQTWGLKDRQLQAMVSEAAASQKEYMRSLTAANRGLPPGELGRSRWEQIGRSMQPWVKQLLAEGLKKMDPPPAVTVSVFGQDFVVTGEPWENDAGDLVFFRAGKFDKAKHFLEPWLPGLLTACAGRDRRLVLHSESGRMEKSPALQTRAAATLAQLVQGYLIGKQRPLAFDLEASIALVAHLEKNAGALSGTLVSGALVAASANWNQASSFRTGAAHNPSSQLLWREVDPFAAPGWEADARHWAEAIASPLQNWIKAQ